MTKTTGKRTTTEPSGPSSGSHSKGGAKPLPIRAPDRVVVNIRGCNASGKSTIPRSMMDDPTMFVQDLLYSDGKKLADLTVFPSYRWVALGKYTDKNRGGGGMDLIRSTEEIRTALIAALSLFPSYNVVMEGVLASTVRTTYENLFREVSCLYRVRTVFMTLQAPFEVILKRLYERNGGKEINMSYLKDKYRQCTRNIDILRQHGFTSVVLNTESIDKADMLTEFFTSIERIKPKMKPVLCIPSYSRPDGVAIERCKDLPIKKFLFIRKSQLDMYRRWTPWYTLVLQTGGTDIGLVRNNMLRYCSSHGYDWAFMLDDDIQAVEVLGMTEQGTMNSQRVIDKIPGPRIELEALKIWFKVARKYDLAISSPNHRAYDRFNHGLLRVNRSAVIQCILVNVPTLMSLGGYKSIHETGNEDYYVQYKAMSNGCLTGKVGLIEYTCPAVGAGKGGNNTDEYTDINTKYNSYVDTFLQVVCNDPELVTTKTTSRGQKSIQFVWKNWGGFEKSLL